MTEEIRQINSAQLPELCVRILKARSIELNEVARVRDGTIFVTDSLTGPSLIMVYSGEGDEESLSAAAREMADISPAYDCSTLVLMTQERLDEHLIEGLKVLLSVSVWDITRIGAYLHIWQDEATGISQASEEDFVIYGHYRRIDGGNVAGADLTVSFACEGGLLQVEGEAFYGTDNKFGPNIGQLSFIADNWIDDDQSKDEEMPRYSAARRGNKVVYESYLCRQLGEGPYRATFTFNENGLLCEEEHGYSGLFGMNVSFAGNYLRGQFDSDEEKIPESTILDLAYGLSGDFRSHRIGSSELRNWLDQFKTEEQFLMVQLLRQFKFYNNSRVREAMTYLHGKVLRVLEQRSERSGSVIVSACGGPSKSGSSYARIFRQENDLPNNCVVELGKLPEALNKEHSIADAIIFIEDIIGSGQDAVNAINLLDEECGDVLRARQTVVVFAGVCGLVDGISLVRSVDLGFPVKVICMDEVEKCFDSEPNLFDSEKDRIEARRIVLEMGLQLRPDKPLGYEDSQMLVAFYDNCPNNTVPIIWASPVAGTAIRWQPLFPRV